MATVANENERGMGNVDNQRSQPEMAESYQVELWRAEAVKNWASALKDLENAAEGIPDGRCDTGNQGENSESARNS